MALIVFLELQLKAEPLDESYAAVHATLAQTREFAGAISIDVYIDETDPARIVVVETWQNAEAQAAYQAWRATPDGAPVQLGAVLAGTPVARRFADASDI
jgi:quinol monooxygenase YgiN